jgi:hypothetical protein
MNKSFDYKTETHMFDEFEFCDNWLNVKFFKTDN